MKYLLSNPGKFHHFEVGREIFKRNQLHRIICGYPWFKLKNEGIPKNKITSYSLNTIITRYLKDSAFKDYFNIKQQKKIDELSLKSLDGCDVFLGLSQCGLNTGIEAKKRGIKYICERASTHIVYQNELLKEEYNKLNLKYKPIHDWFIQRELEEYKNSNFILLPSNFVEKTFKDKGYKNTKVINFGSWYKQFYPIEKKIKKNSFDIVFVGQISIRKGLHYLFEAFNHIKSNQINLHIIGSKTLDSNFLKKLINKIKRENVYFYGHKSHNEINKIINNSNLFIMPSIEEGMAISIMQAISSGCPVLITENTGAKEFVEKNKCGVVIKYNDLKNIGEYIMDLVENRTQLKLFKENAIQTKGIHTWSKYFEELDKIVRNL